MITVREANKKTMQAIHNRAIEMANQAPPLSDAQIVHLRAIFGRTNHRHVK